MASKNYYTVAGAVLYRKEKGAGTTFPTIAKAVKSGTLPIEGSFNVFDGRGRSMDLIPQDALDKWTPRTREGSSTKIAKMMEMGISREQAEKIYSEVIRQKSAK
jgi:hypothetical protein